MIYRKIGHITVISIIIANIIYLYVVDPLFAQSSLETEESITAIKFHLKTTIVDRYGKVSTAEGNAYKWGKLIRYESDESDLSDQHKEAKIFDFEDLKEYRMFFKDKIYFEYPIHRNYLIRVQREGLIPFDDNPNIEIRKINLGEVVIDNHPATIYLRVRTLKESEETGRKKRKKRRLPTEYTLVWEATDFKDIPLQVLYSQYDYTIISVEYRNPQSVKLKPSFFKTPTDYLNLSPY